MDLILKEGMKVIWADSTDKKGGVASIGYMNNGMQDKIISAFECVLERAKSQKLYWNERDGMVEAREINTASDNKI